MFFMLLIKIVLCSEPHCQEDLKWKHISYENPNPETPDPGARKGREDVDDSKPSAESNGSKFNKGEGRRGGLEGRG